MVDFKKKKNIQTNERRPNSLLSDLQLNRVQRFSVASSKTLLNCAKESLNQKNVLEVSGKHNWFTVQDNSTSKGDSVVGKPFFLLFKHSVQKQKQEHAFLPPAKARGFLRGESMKIKNTGIKNIEKKFKEIFSFSFRKKGLFFISIILLSGFLYWALEYQKNVKKLEIEIETKTLSYFEKKDFSGAEKYLKEISEQTKTSARPRERATVLYFLAISQFKQIEESQSFEKPMLAIQFLRGVKAKLFDAKNFLLKEGRAHQSLDLITRIEAANDMILRFEKNRLALGLGQDAILGQSQSELSGRKFIFGNPFRLPSKEAKQKL